MCKRNFNAGLKHIINALTFHKKEKQTNQYFYRFIFKSTLSISRKIKLWYDLPCIKVQEKKQYHTVMGLLLLTWTNFNPSMDK